MRGDKGKGGSMEWSQGKGERFDIWGQGFEREREGADAGRLVFTAIIVKLDLYVPVKAK